MNENAAVWECLRGVFADVFGEEIELTPEMSAEDVDGWDSVRHVELMVAVEQAFGVRFTTAEIAGFANVDQLAGRLAAASS